MTDERASRAGLLRQAAVTLAAFVVAGVVAAGCWFWWWSPAPETHTYLIDGGRPFFEPDQQFRSTGLYLAVAVPLGLVLGAIFLWIHDHDELVTLGLVVGSAIVAGLVMVGVGALIGPGEPAPIDLTADYPDGYPSVQAALRASPVAWFLGFPGGALVGSVLVLVGFPGDAAVRRVDPAAVDVPPSGQQPVSHDA
ncbi:hypothetical protein [Nocardioides alcanivorans]|uniref:hypothetical protein n=1 Tax=Nocardioides alcanivorans TaxID=2897352 RepID=UPI001F2CF65D|nr:hypothetical protein [Nocardioides alcanivorans]